MICPQLDSRLNIRWEADLERQGVDPPPASRRVVTVRAVAVVLPGAPCFIESRGGHAESRGGHTVEESRSGHALPSAPIHRRKLVFGNSAVAVVLLGALIDVREACVRSHEAVTRCSAPIHCESRVVTRWSRG